jgi:hypothetical protein
VEAAGIIDRERPHAWVRARHIDEDRWLHRGQDELRGIDPIARLELGLVGVRETIEVDRCSARLRRLSP